MQNPDKIFGRLSNRMFQMAALYAYCKDNNFPIFVQDEKYFIKYKDEIIALFSEGISKEPLDFVSVHVRRGKNPINPAEPAYSENSFYVDLGHHLHEDMSDSYYAKAMAMFPNEKFLIFSDDIKWCFKQPIFKDCSFYHSDEIDDLNTMASCKSNIIANSSFSFWCAILNPNPNKIVVSPKHWYADPENEKFTVRPDSWIKI